MSAKIIISAKARDYEGSSREFYFVLDLESGTFAEKITKRVSDWGENCSPWMELEAVEIEISAEHCKRKDANEEGLTFNIWDLAKE